MAAGAAHARAEAFCPIYLALGDTPEKTIAGLRTQLEEASASKKVAALEQAIWYLLKGHNVSSLLMNIIRYVLPSNDHRLKKLVHLFIQVFDFCKPDGTLIEEGILVCNALRNDLTSPNEFVRGSALRMIAKLRYWSIVSPMVPAVVENLTHAVPYVHRNALVCLAKIAERFGPECVLSAIAETERLLLGSGDPSVCVQAFNLLRVCEPALAVQYLLDVEGALLSYTSGLHGAMIRSFTELCAVTEQARSLMMRILLVLMEYSPDNAVRVEGANVVCRLKSTPVEARRAAAGALAKVLMDESDLNVKILLIGKLNILYARSFSSGDVPNVLEDHVMDLVRAMSGATAQVVTGLLSLALRSLTRQNVDSLLQAFKKAFTTAEDIPTYTPERVAQYRVMLIKAINYTCGRFPERCGIVYDMLLGYLGHHHEQTAEDCATFFKQLVDLLPNLRDETIVKLLTFLEFIPHPGVLSTCFWVIGEHANSPKLSSYCIGKLYEALSPFPFVKPSKLVSEAGVDAAVSHGGNEGTVAPRTVVLQDGTYGAQITEDPHRASAGGSLRALLVNTCNPVLYCALAQCLLKISHASGDRDCTAKAALIVGNLIRLMEQPQNVGVHSQKRIRTILKLSLGLLKDPDQFRPLVEEYLRASRTNWRTRPQSPVAELKGNVEDPMTFDAIFGRSAEDDWSFEDDLDDEVVPTVEDLEIEKVLDVEAAIRPVVMKEATAGALGDVHQFTALLDQLYIEATVSVSSTRVHLTLYLHNVTDLVMQDVRVDIYANDRVEMLGHVPLTTIRAHSTVVQQVACRLTQNHGGVIHGYVQFNRENSVTYGSVPFNPMPLSVYDYITPCFISPTLFRSLWAESEWEHKVNLQPSRVEPLAILRNILKATHMTVVSPASPTSLRCASGPVGHAEFLTEYLDYMVTQPEVAPLTGKPSFFALNLFCRTLFDQEVVANMSVVRQPDSLYSGLFKIRSSTEIADRVPFDMVEDWQERNDHVFRDRLAHMPEQFAEASHRYSSDPRDHLLASLLRHCTSRRPRGGANDVERSRFMASVAESTAELLDRLLACECGIVLRCLLKASHRDYALQRALIERMLQRGQVFSPYAAVSALTTLVEGHTGGGASQWRANQADTDRLLRRLLAQIRGHLHQFNLATLSRLTNSASRLPGDVSGLLSAVREALFDRHVPAGDAALWTEEAVHFFANGFSRKGMLDKPLFDLLRDRIVGACPAYSVDTLASLSNAYSKFGSAEGAGYVHLFSRLADEIVAQRRGLTSRHVCVVANAFAMACVCHEHLFEVLDDTFVFGIDGYGGRQIAMMIHAFNKVGYRSRNHCFIWRKCTEHLDSFSWQGLTMVFHAYTKGELRDDATTATFCRRFESLFDALERRAARGDTTPPPGADLPQPTTYVSLAYSLVKGNILHCHGLLVHLAKVTFCSCNAVNVLVQGCLSNMAAYEPDEIANLTLAFSRIHNSASPARGDGDDDLWQLSRRVLQSLTRRLGEPGLKFSAFSVRPQPAPACLLRADGQGDRVSRRVRLRSKLPGCPWADKAQHLNSRPALVHPHHGNRKSLAPVFDPLQIRALATIGAHDEDVLAVLHSLKHNKSLRQPRPGSPPAVPPLGA
ncbi:coatomer subunit beta-1 [Babesia caballi]|uniref:Coatomer subunit beta-1 n=1 Tax=Babesia caballi TaxID=5871 RepID=A0AAV4LRE8_BABCB|nr:coatomer subunit beta-1 [Babesia caballi]